MTDRNDTAGPGSPPPDGATSHIDDDLCIDVVRGLRPSDEIERAMMHVRRCRECEVRLIDVAALQEMARTYPVPARRDSSGPIPPPSVNRTPTRARRILRVTLPLGLAAAILVLVTILTRHSPSGESYWMPTTGDLLDLRGAHLSDSDSVLWAGLNAYQAHDIRNSISLLESAHAAGGLDDLRRLYLASLLINSNRPGETLKLLEDLRIETLPLPWRQDAYWMEYLARSSLHQDAEARSRLDEMATWPGRVGDLARERKKARG